MDKEQLLSMYEAKVKELAEAKQLIEQLQVSSVSTFHIQAEYAQFDTLQKKGELVDVN